MNGAPAACRYLTARLDDVPRSLAWLAPGEGAALAWLSSRERAALDRLHVAKRRQDWLLGRWTAKQAVAAVLAATDGARPPLRAIEILAAPDGAPEVFVGTVASPCAISISHRAGRALCAVVPRGVAVGCDVEHVEPRDEALVDDFFAPDEAATVRRREGRARDLLVALVWSAKESALKLLREGLRLDTRSARVEVGEASLAGEDWRSLSVRCDGLADVVTGWWRTSGDDVLTVVTGAPGAPPEEITVAEAGR